MTRIRHIALLLAMAIATIAVGLTPSTVQAHEGAPHAAVSAAPHHLHAAAAAPAQAVVPAEIGAASHLDCAGPCCTSGGHHGSCCCATGLAPSGAAAALPPARSMRAPPREPAGLAGIVPEALPEPPRPLA